MNLFWDALLAVLMVTPASDGVLGSVGLHPYARQELGLAASRWDWIEPRWGASWFTHPNQHANDMRLLRGAAREMVTWPPSYDALRLPDFEACLDGRQFALGCQERFTARRDLCLGGMIQEAVWCERVLDQLRVLLPVYDLLSIAANPQCSIYLRRRSLNDLRDRLGLVAYQNGWWPQPVPWWDFQVIE
jgi:hypothetical protein